MNASLLIHEILLSLLATGILLADLWMSPEERKSLPKVALAGVGLILLISFVPGISGDGASSAFGGMFVLDGMALFFKRLFLAVMLLVLLIAIEFEDRIPRGQSEYVSLILFAGVGMLFAASANNFALLFVSLELITITFYILTSFQRSWLVSLEAGVKYLIMGAVAAAFLVFGIALVYGTTGSLDFGVIAEATRGGASSTLLSVGLLMVLAGLGFKIAAVPLQIWTPDVYQGAPTPTTAFLAVGSKAAGFVLLLRVLFTAVPEVTQAWTNLLIGISAATILYGNLCAIPQTNIKRLLGYSSIAQAGYLLMGVAAFSEAGQAAVLFYLGGYLFTVLAAFTVIAAVLRETGAEDIKTLAGLHQRSPLMAVALAASMVSLAGIPPLVGFFGKFLLIKSALAAGAANHGFYCLVGVAIVGVVISIYYYFGVVRAIYWADGPSSPATLAPSLPTKIALVVCLAGMFILGVLPSCLLNSAMGAAFSGL